MATISIGSIDKLVIYGNGEILMEKTRDLANISGLDRLVSFEIDNSPVKARKENLNRKDNYYLPYRPDWDRYSKTARTALYIHVSEVTFESCGEYVDVETNGAKHYLYKYNVTFKNATARRVSVEKMNVPGSWTLPDGAKWHRIGDYDNTYEIIDDATNALKKEIATKTGEPFTAYNMAHWTTETVTEPITVTYKSERYHKIEKDAAREQREELAAAFNEIISGNHFSHYDIEKLFKKFDITPKAEKPDAIRDTVKAMGQIFNPDPETATA